jgi:Fe-Mn family superoxide dismutase
VRADYVKAFWTVTDWENVSARFEKARDTTSGLITL